jgi:large subunit ribosomal protein L22
MSPRKARLVAEHIRGRSVPEARTILAFTPRAAAREVDKVLRSAVANAEANHGLDGDELVVAAAYVDDAVTMKRWRAQARGRAARIRKRTCHITVKLAPAEAPPPGADTETTRRRARGVQAGRQAPATRAPETPAEEQPGALEEPSEGAPQPDTAPEPESEARPEAEREEARE